VEVRTGAEVDRLIWRGDRAVGAVLVDGTEIRVAKGVVLAAGSIGSPAILMRSGLGPRGDLERLGIDVRLDAPGVGENLQDHPGVGLHHEGPGSGYGLDLAQWPRWGLAPLAYLFRRGPLASPTCEAGAFFDARGEGGAPDVQTHFIPFFLAHEGPRYQRKAGYFADVCLCRPASRGSLRLASKDPGAAPLIDLGLFREESDLDTMVAGVERLRTLLVRADFGSHRAPEVWPGPGVTGEALKDHIRNHAGTAYHPAGTLALGGPVSARLKVEGVEGLWAADASVMPRLTSANTNAPAMMIGWRGAAFIAEDAA
jgi:choline dehydrogenase